jgi:hypothetical protein
MSNTSQSKASAFPHKTVAVQNANSADWLASMKSVTVVYNAEPVLFGSIAALRRTPNRIGLLARLAMCDPSLPETAEEREWLDAPSVGREIIR